ncbi:hypothetical protein Forpe1208_v003355 [Fusarium oxysporum f. sp. rapae]|uniref:Uncharacterized protein n=1 Tax=Fusarium oxysporum f. sp. rapae TaxID=485398 RepID=A0A8J5PBB5_FUSOX|nr:hypothetical protein Forpe1208_v003355 [Fusarium oxysporum f. sp. rapae]
MTNYTLYIKTDGPHIRELQENGYRLCFGCAVNVFEKKTFNVIPSAHEITSEIMIQWTDDYGIAASRDRFNRKSKFSVFTPNSEIKIGQTYTVPQDGSLGTVADSTDPDAPMQGFRFFNEADKASPVVYQTITVIQ